MRGLNQGTVTATGAELFYEERGDGPPVLIIQGGVSEAGATEQLAEALAHAYRVISYDRRGLSRSAVSDETLPATMSRHAEDAAVLLAALATEPAHVVGASIGALTALHLAVQHPERVATLVAHEPPMAAVVKDHEREEALDQIAELARKDVRAAIRRMGSLTGGRQSTTEDGARSAPPVGDIDANLRRFFGHDFPAVRASQLTTGQIAAARSASAIVPTGGIESRGQWEYRCAHKLAQDLQRDLEEMPGGHNGLISHPWATARKLDFLFRNARTHVTAV
ncbi:alpha/beta hydrolase [Amycolatopsis taiwanensis]|uniref:Alpha/beta hydrolase n=1 Tax=Amycolatopsis taiwanensis TaxID=342230 RepID=A0A9W6R5K7_9PSEU|nr:alpha/beta hydrolase [Amycolatopsis taiwanensis]